MDMKVCATCRQPKPFDAFTVDRTRADGRHVYCKDCQRKKRAGLADTTNKHRREQYANNPSIRERMVNYVARKRDSINQRRKEWRAENNDASNERRRAKYATNKDAILSEQREYRARNADLIRERDRQRYQQNPERFKANARNRKARKKNASGTITARQWQALKSKYNHTCLCCGEREPDIQLTVDHVVPLIHGGANTIANIQPLCLTCNLRKSTKTIDYRGRS